MNPVLDELLAATAPEPPQPVPMPGGKTVYVRAMTAAEGLMLQAKVREGINGKGPAESAAENAALFLSAYLCDEQGNPIIETIEDARRLVAGMKMRYIERIVSAGRKLNAVDAEGEPEAEALVKN